MSAIPADATRAAIQTPPVAVPAAETAEFSTTQTTPEMPVVVDLTALSADPDPLRTAVCKAVAGDIKFHPQSGEETIRLVMGSIGREQAPVYGLLLLQLINEHREFFTRESETLTSLEAKQRAQARINNLDNVIKAQDAKQAGTITLDPLWNIVP